MKNNGKRPVDDPQNDPHREVGRRLLAAILSCQFGIGLEYTLRNYVPEQVDPSWGQLGWSLQRFMAENNPFAQIIGGRQSAEKKPGNGNKKHHH